MERQNIRKYRAHTQKMSITYFKLMENQIDFKVGVIGSQRKPYILNFSSSTLDVTCSCPDYEMRQHKPLCKHMLFIVHISNQSAIFNNILNLSELKDVKKMDIIKKSLMIIIDKKKLNSDQSEDNTESIERDDFCSICMCELSGKIEKCSECKHVMHYDCITGWWNLSGHWNSTKGKCPYCRADKGFAHVKLEDEDPWKFFNFGGSAAEEPQPESQPEPQQEPQQEPQPEPQQELQPEPQQEPQPEPQQELQPEQNNIIEIENHENHENHENQWIILNILNVLNIQDIQDIQ